MQLTKFSTLVLSKALGIVFFPRYCNVLQIILRLIYEIEQSRTFDEGLIAGFVDIFSAIAKFSKSALTFEICLEFLHFLRFYRDSSGQYRTQLQESLSVLRFLVLFPVDKITQVLTVLIRINVVYSFTEIHISTLNVLLFRVQLEVKTLRKGLTTSPHESFL